MHTSEYGFTVTRTSNTRKYGETASTLWVEGSPKQDQSLSSSVAKAFMDAADAQVVGEVERLNVWEPQAVSFGRDAAIAKFAPLLGDSRTPEQSKIWDDVLAHIEWVRGFDRLVVSSPMWNWHIPHALKGWIDIIVQPIASFTLDAQGKHVGALGDGRPLHLILTRSSAYSDSNSEMRDFQQPYLEHLFTMIGYQVDTLVIEPTTRWTPEERGQMRERALADGRKAGSALGSHGTGARS